MKPTTLLAMVFLLSISAAAATFNVGTTADTQDAAPGNGICADSTGRCSLRAAITESNALGGVKQHKIYLPAGTYSQTLGVPNNDNANANGDWDINSSVALIGSGMNNTTLRPAIPLNGLATERVLEILGPANVVSISGLVIERGRLAASGSQGGGIRNLGTLSLEAVRVSSNQSAAGGGVYSEGSLSVGGLSLIQNNRCAQNFGVCRGGGIYSKLGAGLTLNIVDSNIVDNESNSSGANPGDGAGLMVEAQGGSQTTIAGSNFQSNLGGGGNSHGAGIYYVAISGISTFNLGGGSVVQLNRFAVNTAGITLGVGVAVETAGGSVAGQWSGLRLSQNSLQTEQSSLNTRGGNLSLHVYSGNMDISLKESSVTRGNAYFGGGISLLNESSSYALNFTATNVTIGGSHSNHPDPNSSLDGYGGGVYMPAGALAGGTVTATFNFCTFTQNVAGQGRGHAIYRNGAGRSVYLKNSVLVNNYSSPWQINGLVTSQGYNHFDYNTPSQVVLTANDTVGPAGLDTVPTNQQYYLPASGGPLLNMIPYGFSGCGTDVTRDQRGLARPVNGACDKGAIEVQ